VHRGRASPRLDEIRACSNIEKQQRYGRSPSGVKRLRPTGCDVRRSIEVNRDLLYETDEHLKRDA